MNILLAIDASPSSEAAINEVMARPWPSGTTVEVLSVVEMPSWALPEVVEEAVRRTEELVKRATEQLRSRGLKAGPRILSGHPKEVIVDHAGQMATDLVVIGSSGDTGLTRLLLGSVADVVRFSPCSVEVVRGAARQMGAPMKVLLATDGSDGSALAAWSIALRPWPPDTEIRIFNVVDLGLSFLQAAFEPPFGQSAALEEQRAEAMKHSQEAIRSAEEILTGVGLKTSEMVSVLVDPPQQLILNDAAEWGADRSE